MDIKKIEGLLALRGKIAIEYDWEREEKLELKAAEDDLIIFQSVERSSRLFFSYGIVTCYKNK